MNISNVDSFFKDGSVISYYYGGGDSFTRQKEFEHDLRSRYPSDNDPEKPPPWQPGDRITVIGTITGMIIGGALGCIASWLLYNIGIFGLLPGILVGGIIGAIIGDKIRRRRLKI